MGESARDAGIIAAYLERLRAALRGLPEEQIRDIVEELRSHIADKLTGGTAAEAALESLGGAEEIAGEYLSVQRAAALGERALVKRSAILTLGSLLRYASLSVAGFFALLGSLCGYGLGLSLVGSALLKPLHPHTAGLWSVPAAEGGVGLSLRMGFGAAPAGGRDLLGWWIVPIGLVAGLMLFFGTLEFGLWCVEKFGRRRSR
jgi:hypothetical protein